MKGRVAIIGVLAAIILALGVLSLSFQRTLQMETADQFNRQQLLQARTEAAGIQHYLDGVRDKLATVARAVSQLQVRSDTDLTLLTDVLFDDTRKVKKRIEFIGPAGERLFTRSNTTIEGPDTGTIAGRRGLCSGGVLTRADTKILTLVAPVCRQKTFLGAMAVSIAIQDIAEAHLGPMKAGSKSYAWMMDGGGNLLYHPGQADMVGRNLYRADASCFGCHRSFELEKKIIEGKGEVYGRYVAPSGEDKILAFSTVTAGDARWIVAASSPYSEITQSVGKSMKIYSWVIILIFLVTSGVAAMLIVENRKRERAVERSRREKELEMMHAEKLASLERLTSGITSEIGSPLTSVFSFVDVLMDMERDEFKRETLETIYFHMNKIADILQQLSRYSKMLPVAPGPCRLNSLIEGSLALIQYDQKVQNITVVRDLAPDLPEIMTDGNQLSQVFVNLILNGADAMPKGGTLTIRSRVKDGRVNIEFEDAGVGISPEDLKNIFDPFYTTKEKGTGLGLAVSYGIIQRLKGSLSALSEPGKGTKIVLELPVDGSA